MALMRFASKSVVLLIVGAVVVFFVGLGSSGLFGLPGVTKPFQSKTVDRSQPALLVSIQKLSEYHSVVGNFEVVIDNEDDVPWVPSLIAGERSLFVAAGTVDAYIDFSGLAEGDLTLSQDGKSVEIRLPEAKLSKPNLDQDRTYLFSQDRGIINRYGDALSTQDQSELYQQAEKKLATAAEVSELKLQAEKNTKAMLTGLFNSLDIKATFAD